MTAARLIDLKRLGYAVRASRYDAGLVIVTAAGVQPDLLAILGRLRFADWFPAERIVPEEDDRDSATIKAVRQAYAALRTAPAGKLYSLV